MRRDGESELRRVLPGRAEIRREAQEGRAAEKLMEGSGERPIAPPPSGARIRPGWTRLRLAVGAGAVLVSLAVLVLAAVGARSLLR